MWRKRRQIGVGEGGCGTDRTERRRRGETETEKGREEAVAGKARNRRAVMRDVRMGACDARNNIFMVRLLVISFSVAAMVRLGKKKYMQYKRPPASGFRFKLCQHEHEHQQCIIVIIIIGHYSIRLLPLIFAGLSSCPRQKHRHHPHQHHPNHRPNQLRPGAAACRHRCARHTFFASRS